MEKINYKKTDLGNLFNIFTGKKNVNETDPNGAYDFFSCAPEIFKSKEYLYDGEAIIIAGNGSYTGTTRYFDGKFDLYQRTYALTPKNKSSVDTKYIFYLLKNYFEPKVMGGTRGSSIPYIVMGDISNYEISLPPLPEQHRIANILSSFDNKIELLRKENNTLEDIAQSIFKEWFVKYNFPNKDGKPYRDNNGKMIDSELGLIPEGWRVGKLGEIVNCFDSKRFPLAKEIREQRKGIYPYYGATQVMGYVDSFLFDGKYLLLAEDGSVQTEKGHPILQLIDEKFWVNNHTHVLQGKDPFTTEYLYLLMKDFNITNIITGAVQPKINQNNLLDLKIIIPNTKILAKYNLAQYIFNEILRNKVIFQSLMEIKDNLLKELIH